MNTVTNFFRTQTARLRLARLRARHWAATRADPMETHHRMRAQSLLAGTAYRDGSTNPGTLSLEQARDVLAWATTRNT